MQYIDKYKSPPTSGAFPYIYNFLFNLAKDNMAYNQVVIHIGSNRQSLYHEFISHFRHLENQWYKMGLSYFEIPRIAEFLKRYHNHLSFNPFLLSDIYGNLTDGESFKRAKSDLENIGINALMIDTQKCYDFLEKLKNNQLPHEHKIWFFDETKFSILYAQMHKQASEHPNDEIVFDFFDDREDILMALSNYFSRHLEFIPRNTTLCLNKFNGNELNHPNKNSKTAFPIILNGLGEINVNYRQAILDRKRELENFTQQFNLNDLHSKGFIHYSFIFENIYDFKYQIDRIKSEIIDSQDAPNLKLEIYHTHLNKMYLNINNFTYENYATALANTMNQAETDYNSLLKTQLVTEETETSSGNTLDVNDEPETYFFNKVTKPKNSTTFSLEQ